VSQDELIVVLLKQSEIDIDPVLLYTEVCLNTENVHAWNSEIAISKVIEDIGPNLRITHQVSAPIGGGWIDSRDFIVLGMIKKIGEDYFMGYASTEYEDNLLTTDYVRAYNGPGALIFSPRPNEKGKRKTFVRWLMNVDLKFPHIVPAAVTERVLLVTAMNTMTRLKEIGEKLEKQ
jgi:hypothetical protein